MAAGQRHARVVDCRRRIDMPLLLVPCCNINWRCVRHVGVTSSQVPPATVTRDTVRHHSILVVHGCTPDGMTMNNSTTRISKMVSSAVRGSDADSSCNPPLSACRSICRLSPRVSVSLSVSAAGGRPGPRRGNARPGLNARTILRTFLLAVLAVSLAFVLSSPALHDKFPVTRVDGKLVAVVV